MKNQSIKQTENNVITPVGGRVELSRDLDMEQAAEYLKMDMRSLEWLVSKKRIPYHLVNGKNTFKESNLFYWYHAYFNLPSLSDDKSFKILVIGKEE